MSDDTGGDGGAYRGDRTNEILGTIAYFERQYQENSDTPPGAFGGSGDAFTGPQLQLICAVKAFAEKKDIDMNPVAQEHAATLNYSVDVILAALENPDLCPLLQTAAPTHVVLARTTPFYVTADGVPVSSNPTCNKCVTGHFTEQDIQNNPDRTRGNMPKSCSAYHTDDSWYQPDLHVFFTWDAKTKELYVPDGYTITTLKTVTLNK